MAFQDPDVKLVPPDRFVISGKIQGPLALVPVETEIQVSVTDDGKPQVAAKRLSAIGVEVPSGAFDALNKRIEEANKTLPEQITPGETVKRLFVEETQIVAELAGGATAPPVAGTPAAPKPGG